MNKKTQKFGISAFFSALMLLNGFNAYAATPATLSSTPLFVSTAVEPNVFFTFDDSGSMGWETMVQDGTDGYSTSGGRPIIRGFTKEYYNTEWESDYNVIPPESLVPGMWVFRNFNGNKNYYNPNITYTPWAGEAPVGNALRDSATGNWGDANETCVPEWPYSGSCSTDLTQRYTYYLYPVGTTSGYTGYPNAYYIPTYSIWNDTDNDGVIESSDSSTLIEITPGTAEMQNFANWFVYYRTREFAAKAAIGRVINNTDATRMGLDVFNAGHQEDLATMTVPAKKSNLLNTFYNVWSSGGTPAHRSMKRVGDLFQQTGSSAPIFSSALGGECQQNFNIVMTDGFWNSYKNPNVNNADSSGSAGMTDPANGKGFDGNATESNDAGNYEDSWSNTLGDVAMHYYETDLRSDLADKVPVQPGVDSAVHQHLVTYTIGFGLTGTLDPVTDDPATGGATFWPNPMDTEDEERVDDLWHAAYNGRGQFLSAQNPEELELSLNAAIEDIAERTATASAVAVTSARLTTASVVYLSEFNTNRWQGTIFAYPIIEDPTTGVLSLATSPAWSAAQVLDNRDLNTDPRVILSTDDGATGGSQGIPFQWSTITNDMKDDLRTNSLGGTDSDTIAEARLDYLRGSRANEGAGYQFRQRATLLGDIVHSGPSYVAAPNLRWPDEAPFPVGSGTKYSAFKEAQENRAGVVYVGANDGMVHGFSEATGKELLAYMPSNLFSTSSTQGLHYLTQQNYVHQYYNDLSPAVSDVFINSGGGDAWHTILVAGQRAGGRGYSALDITNPGNFSESNADDIVFWEFNSDDDPDMGYTFSRPQIGMTNDGEWVAVFGNGYNSTGDYQAKLFIVKIEAGLDGTWSAGDYTEISTGVGSAASPNGLSTPALADLDENGTIDRAYAGDLDGNMWVFDLSGASTGSWKLAYSGNPLFTTIGSRPITGKPAISFHPTETTESSNKPNIMVTFGSGQYMVDTDKNSTHNNNFYGIWDSGSSNLTSSNLVEQTYRTGFSERVLTRNAVDYNIKKGWFINLPDSGERNITNTIIRSGFVFFNTSVPSSDACATGGYGYRFVVDLATGGTPDEAVIDINQDGVVDDNDTIGSLKDVASAQRYDRLLTDDTITEKHLINQRELTAIKDAPDRQTGRVSWQELLQ